MAEVFDFFRRPANLVRISPPELHMQLESGPELVELSLRVILKGRHRGIPQRIVSRITVFEADTVFTDEQEEGPFRRWKHTHRFETLPDGGTRVSDVIDYDPPGGALGLFVTGRFIDKDLHWIFDVRRERLKELLGE